jgi:CRP/FNR family transcriptional activator FtrB
MFEQLDEAVLAALDAITDQRDVAEGQELCRQGAMPEALHVLLDGQVVLTGTAPDGTSAVVEVVRPIGYFVLAAVLTELPYLMTGHSIMPSRLLVIEAAALRELLTREAALARAMLLAEALDFRTMVRQVRDLKLRSAAQRLGCYLLALATDPQANTAEFRLPFDKGLLAARLGCRQENLSRAFAALRGAGVETHGSRIILHDMARLAAFSMPDELADPPLLTDDGGQSGLNTPTAGSAIEPRSNFPRMPARTW